ncbi:phosphotransferase [Rickettsia conorii]
MYKWIEGKSANSFDTSSLNLSLIASDLAKFLNALHKIDIIDGLVPGTHNFWRGGDLAVYDLETKIAIKNLKDLVDADKVLSVWEKALNSQWNKKPVWIHGDFASSNIIIKNGKLNTVIDFGGMGIGNPACDLVIIWTFLQNEAREIFKEQLALDDDTWARARGGALWKALIAPLDGLDAVKNLQIIHDILYEHEK